MSLNWSVARRWTHALKPASWPKLLVPMVLGQALGISAVGCLSFGGALAGLAFTVADLGFIVLLNDWGDRDVDAIKRRLFPEGCSPKTIPDGILPAHHLLGAGLAAGVAAIAIAAVASTTLDRPGLTLAAALLLVLFGAYTLPPLKLNYRGGGELLEMIGVGVALPLFNAYVQSGLIPRKAAGLLPGFVALSLASAIASGLADEQSDRKGGKRTVVTMVGNPLARRLVEVSVILGLLLWLAAPLSGWVGWLPSWGGALVVAVFGQRLLRSSADAQTNAFAAQKVYKRNLHGAIWWGAITAAGLLSLEISWR